MPVALGLGLLSALRALHSFPAGLTLRRPVLARPSVHPFSRPRSPPGRRQRSPVTPQHCPCGLTSSIRRTRYVLIRPLTDHIATGSGTNYRHGRMITFAHTDVQSCSTGTKYVYPSPRSHSPRPRAVHVDPRRVTCARPLLGTASVESAPAYEVSQRRTIQPSCARGHTFVPPVPREVSHSGCGERPNTRLTEVVSTRTRVTERTGAPLPHCTTLCVERARRWRSAQRRPAHDGQPSASGHTERPRGWTYRAPRRCTRIGEEDRRDEGGVVGRGGGWWPALPSCSLLSALQTLADRPRPPCAAAVLPRPTPRSSLFGSRYTQPPLPARRLVSVRCPRTTATSRPTPARP